MISSITSRIDKCETKEGVLLLTWYVEKFSKSGSKCGCLWSLEPDWVGSRWRIVLKMRQWEKLSCSILYLYLLKFFPYGNSFSVCTSFFFWDGERKWVVRNSRLHLFFFVLGRIWTADQYQTFSKGRFVRGFRNVRLDLLRGFTMRLCHRLNLNPFNRSSIEYSP